MNFYLFALFVLLIFLAGTGAGRTLEKNKVFHKFFPPKEKVEFSIGIYHGNNPLKMKPYEENPVLTKEDVTDRKAAYVADPFMIKVNNFWYMFFEIRIADSYITELAYAVSVNGFEWDYVGVIENSEFFRSYPHVFEFEGEYYMTLENYFYNSVVIYKAERFPEKWVSYVTIAKGRDYVDPTIFRRYGRWWCFASTTKNEDLYLFYADKLEGPWTEHLLSPVVRKDKSSARPAGRVIEYVGDTVELYRFAQDCSNYYGERVLAFKINKLTTTEYYEEPAGVVLGKGEEEGWNSKGMHTFDAHATEKGWIAAVDGQR